MRFWIDSSGGVITDDQLLRYISTFGSLSSAARMGDIELLVSSADRAGGPRAPRGKSLSSYIEKDDSTEEEHG